MSLPTENIILNFLTPRGPKTFFSLKINVALIDTGSQRTLIRKGILDSNRIPLKKLTNKMFLRSFGISHSKISPYNSRANFVERSHKELRDILLTLNTNSLNYRFKIKIGINFYNSRPQKTIGYLSPSQMLMGINSNNLLSHFQSPKLEENENSVPELVEKNNKWVEYVQDLRHELALKNAKIYSCKIENEPIFEVGDLVILVNNTLRLSKLKNNRSLGIFLITKRNLNSYHCRNLITNVNIIRNGRNIRKLHLEQNVAEKLKAQNFTLREGHFLAPFDPEIAAASGTKFELIIDTAEEKPSFEKYNFRKRT